MATPDNLTREQYIADLEDMCDVIRNSVKDSDDKERNEADRAEYKVLRAEIERAKRA